MSATPDAAGLRCEQYRLPCGCFIDIVRDRARDVRLSRTIARRAGPCRKRSHQPGAGVYPWELLPTHRAVISGYP